ncbi:MAG TPA: hemolysin family protein [Spirochaetia bacterium]|nr:hemolysin family protein [Spirochaetia bacterium]
MLLELAIILGLVLLNGFFSMSEMAIVSSRKARLRHEADKGRKGYRMALETAENPSRFLSTIQVVITLVSILAGAFGGATVAEALEEALRAIAPLAAYAGPLSVGLVVVCTTFVSVVLGELVPKSLALARPEPVAAALIRPVRALALAFAPISRLLSGTTELLVGLLGSKGQAEPAVTEDEVRVLVAQGAETGVFEDSERDMVEGVLSLGDRRITSLMTPRTELVAIDLEDGVESARELVLANARYGYLPVVEGELDRLVGMLPVKEALAAMAAGSLDDVVPLLEKPLLLPDSISPLKAFAAMREGGARAALILDEYGGLSGLVSLTSLLESMVGELPLSGGEEEEPELVKREDGSYLVDGSMPVDRFVEALGLDEELGQGDYDTVAGLVLERMGTIPRAGDKCRWDGCSLEVVDMDGNRIDKIIVTLEDEAASED